MSEQGREVSGDELEVVTSSEEQASAVDSTFEALLSQIETLVVERDSMRDQFLRTSADFQNFRKRTQQESASLRLFATESLVTSLLPVLDNFGRTVAYMDTATDPVKVFDGIRAVERQLRTILEGQNVRKILTIGEAFDPEVHEALGMETSEEHPENTVVIEIESGYKMGDKVIRPAKVKVSQKP